MKYVKSENGYVDEEGIFFNTLTYMADGQQLTVAPSSLSVKEEVYIDGGFLHREDGVALVRCRYRSGMYMTYEIYAWHGVGIWAEWS